MADRFAKQVPGHSLSAARESSEQLEFIQEFGDLEIPEQQDLFGFRLDELAPLESELRKIPKIDLHAHLSGCVRVSTVRELLDRDGIGLPVKIMSNLQRALSFRFPARSYTASFTPWRILNKITQNPKVIRRLVMELAEDFSKDGVVYTELRVSPRLPLLNGDLSDYLGECAQAI